MRIKQSLIIIFCLFVLSFNFNVYAKGGGKGHHFRKLDTTPRDSESGTIAVTVESNIYQGTTYLSPVVDFSLNGGWNIQVASYNIPVRGGGAQNFEWDSYINVSKTFNISEKIKAIFGTQNGTTALTQTHRWHNSDYALLLYQFTPTSNIHGGPYFANKSLSATTNVIGYTAGFSFEAARNITIQGDYFSGSNNMSGAVLNVLYRLNKKTQAYVGIGIPETNSGNEFYGIIGVVLRIY